MLSQVKNIALIHLHQEIKPINLARANVPIEDALWLHSQPRNAYAKATNTIRGEQIVQRSRRYLQQFRAQKHAFTLNY